MWNPLDDLSPAQREQLNAFAEELARINKRVNLVASSTIPHTEERHLIHSLALAHRGFPDGATVVDFGTGGGLPAVPLAIRFPEVQFVAIDAVRKKTEATRLFARRLGLSNLEVWHGRAEQWDGPAHYAVSRATAPLADLWRWFERVVEPLGSIPENCWPQSLLTLKGGDLTEEIAALLDALPNLTIQRTDLYELLGRPYFRNKEIVAVSDPKG
ncbi:MAG: 16S rRNA (guanine(527)-N(7))-methyltransferase RsmG [Bacteroidetes bacterium]|nr:16S rRNA (guanine(527)-N(7))-methyltransferase RsmG [Bacteroidota bacterium]